MIDRDVIERLSALCAEVGFDLASVDSRVLERMTLLAERSQTVADIERMESCAFALFHFYEIEKPSKSFSEVERRIVVLGCLFSDVGKTGPLRADCEGQRLIVEMFSVEGVRDERQPVSRFLRSHFPEDAEERIARFAALALDPEMPMRQFWNLHAAWTLEIIEFSGVPPEAVAAAATHHLLDDINPEDIVGADHRFTRYFGQNTSFDRAEKLVIVLDKYDALRRRAGLKHDRAIAWLRDRVDASHTFRGDAQLDTLISDLDTVVRANADPPAGGRRVDYDSICSWYP